MLVDGGADIGGACVDWHPTKNALNYSRKAVNRTEDWVGGSVLCAMLQLKFGGYVDLGSYLEIFWMW